MDVASLDVDPKGFDLSSILFVAPMGTNVPFDTTAKLKRFFPNLMGMINAYGSTENGKQKKALNGMNLSWKFAGLLVSTSLAPTNIGHVMPGNVVKIVNQETGQLCGPNEVGEIMSKNDFQTFGYLNRPQETKALWDAEGFLHMGDLGHYDEDMTLHFDGRLKELIKYKNNHLYPIEIEEAIMKHPGVKEVGVFGKPDPHVQELITAVVVKKKGYDSLTEQEIVEFTDNIVDDFKRVRGGVIFANKLPRNNIGKISRKDLKHFLK